MTPGPDQVLLKTGYVGTCGTDHHIWKGDFLTMPGRGAWSRPASGVAWSFWGRAAR